MNNNLITKIEIDSFRSIHQEIVEVGNANVFSGLNDVGKSNILKALNLFFNGQTDFGKNFNFKTDYSKVSLALAQKSAKKKQQVKIKIHFKAPPSFKSLRGKILWIEKTFDRFGVLTEHSSLDKTKQRSSLTRLLNNFKYFYIPALKGPDVLQFIIGEVGKQKLIDEKDISELNDKVNKSIIDLASILTGSSINTETKFELPVFVEDFWSKLSINTKYDEFEKLNNEIGPSKKGKNDQLRVEFYQVPLQLRGEGIKSKFIPPLLQWMQEREQNRQYVWGIDEPENSLEFKKAQEIANLYFNNYAQKTQLFLASHSLAFIFPDESRKVSIFRCTKGSLGETKIDTLQKLFSKEYKMNLAEEIGALEFQKEFYEEWKKKSDELENLKNQILMHKKPLIVTEGNNCRHIKKALEMLDKDLLSKVDIMETDRTGATQLKSAFEIIREIKKDHRIIFVWDSDASGVCESLKESETIFKFCFENNKSNTKVKKGIENLYPSEMFVEDFYPKKESVDEYGAKKIYEEISKKKVLEFVESSDNLELFKNFLPLLDKLRKIL